MRPNAKLCQGAIAFFPVLCEDCVVNKHNDREKKLAARRRKMFRAMLKTMTQAEIGRHFGISRERVRQILNVKATP